MVTHATRLRCRCALVAALLSSTAAAQKANEPAAETKEDQPAGETAEANEPATEATESEPEPDTEATESAKEPAAAPDVTPRLHHAPPAVAEAHRPLIIAGDIMHPHRVRRALLVYRTGERGEFKEIEFRRGAPGPYAATLSERDVNWPSVDYFIELEDVDGVRQPAFASRAEPHRVQVPEDLMDVAERAQSERLEGRRSVVSAFGEYVDFGRSPAMVQQSGGTTEERLVEDRYYRIEAAYTYRLLRTVNEFSIRLGMVRGRAPVPNADSNDFDVGLNYGSPSIRLRMGDAWHLDGQFLTSVTEVGFSIGGGGALHIGDPYGTQFVFGFETIEVFGTRFFSRVDVLATDRLILSPMIEATNMPHADQYGVRLLGEIAYGFGSGFTLGVSGGYQAREATSGGPSAGLRAAWAL